MSLYKPSTRRWLGGLFLGGFLALFGLAFFGTVRQARADDGTSNPATGTTIAGLKALEGACTAAYPCPPKGSADALEETDNAILKPALETALLSVLLNLVQYVLDRLAYEAAVAIAAGGEGETSLFYSDDPSEAWKNFGLDVAGEAIGELNDVTNAALNTDFNICSPTNPLIDLALQLGIKQQYQPQEPACDFQDVVKNWDSFITTTVETASNPSEQILQTFADGLRPGQNELSAALTLNIKVNEKVSQLKSQKFLEQINSGGFKNVTDVITGQVKTPSSVLQTQFNDQLTESRTKGTEFNMNAVINNSHLIGGMLMQVSGVFVNTLLSTLFNRIYTGLFSPEATPNPLDVETISTSGRDDAEARFSNFITSNPISIADYNVITEFVTCPTGGVSVRNLNNCVMDANFAAAVTRAESGTPLTVQEAIDEGLLQGGWPLIPSGDYAKNQDPLCYTYGYCYGNLVKMRKARMIPVGWEIAASRNDQSNPSTLQEIVDGFDNCNDQGTIDTSSHKFCHLIDPNWVLKYPETQCRAYATGEILVSTLSGGRAGYCADTPSCVSEDNDGNCTGGYGYCVLEKNVWRFRGDECPEQYASCLSFTNTDSGALSNLLLNTVDYSVCNADNAGCEWYRTTKYFDDHGTPDDTSDDTYEWLPTGDSFVTADREDDLQYDGSSRTSYSYDTDGDGTDDYSYDTYAHEDRIYFNNNVEECSSAAAGCTQVYNVDNTLILNLVQNPSVEDDADGSGVPDDWSWSGGVGTYNTTGDAYVGTDSVSITHASGAELVQENIELAPNTFYTFSMYARGESASADAEADLTFTDADGNAVDFSGTSFDQEEDCTRSGNTYTVSTVAGDTDWTRYECTFTSLDEPIFGTISLSASTAEVRFDAIQLEAGETATTFTTGYNDSSPTTSYLLVAPPELGCSGDESDPSECDGYTQACTAQDVGCALYAPEDGDPSVPAITTSIDACPSECVGYTTYKQEATLYDDEEFPLYFIADNARSCSEEDVGCDSFTNLDTVENGGEGTEYYTYLRSCLTTDMADGSTNKTAATFFTWEGSDATGYQLKTWSLLQSNSNPANPVEYSQDTDEDGTRDVNDSDYANDIRDDDRPGKAPCTNWEVSSESEVVCRDIVGTTDLEDDDTCNEHTDILDNPDCREFYDEDGNIHYRLFSETVTVSDDCHPYRKTDSAESDCDASNGYWAADTGECHYFGIQSESTECSASANGCREYTGGAGRNATTVFEDTVEDGSLSEYGENGGSSITVSNESVAADGHSMRILTTGAGGSVTTFGSYLDWSNKTTTYDADNSAATCTDIDPASHSVTSSGCLIDYGAGNSCTVEAGDNACGTLDDELAAGKTYVLSFWAKGDGDLNVTFVEQGGSGTSHDFGTVTTDGSWQLFEMGPMDTTDFTNFDDTAILSFNPAVSTTIYVDNVQLKAVEENITLIKDSWSTPATCDQSPTGASSPQYYLGCEAYTDQDGNDGDFYQFSNLCSEEVVGCEAFYDTQNSASAYGQAFNVRCVNDTDGDVTTDEAVSTNTACQMNGTTVCTISTGQSYCLFDADQALPNPLPSNIVLGPEAVIVSNDTPIYLVDDGSTTCDQASMGCEEVGVPTYSQDRSEVTGFDSTYLINLPDSYDDILCDNEALFCEEWSSTQDGNFYFKDPGDKTCEYQSSVTIDNVEYSGWFKTGTSEPCYSDYLIGGSQYGIWRNGDASYDGWGAECSSAYDLCTEFVDTVDTGEGLYPQGTSYDFIDDELLAEDTLQETDRCDGQVSQKEGCALFNNTNDSELTYATDPSYIVSTHADFFYGDSPESLQDPIDCDNGGGSITPPSTGVAVDVCEMRCRYNVGTGNNLTVGNQVEGVNGVNEFVGACITDEDCPVLQGEDGEQYTGTCFDLTGSDNEDNARFQNDANEVLKVNRDRECAAWLACSSSQVSWNARTAKYENICDQVGLCTRYSVTGDTANCTEWADEDPLVLDASQYADRDTSWNGLDYSGYSIPDQLPIETFSQININPGSWCTVDGDPKAVNGDYVPCGSDADCTSVDSSAVCSIADEDLRLAYNAGPCDEDAVGYSGQCTVGFCEDSGDPCSLDADCGGTEQCVVGFCQQVDATGPSCTSNADCTDPAYPICDANQAHCVDVLVEDSTTTCDADDVCSGTNGVCTAAALAKTGSCFNDVCLTDVDGQPLTRGSAASAECRGYPEATSPYGEQVVQDWMTPGETPPVSTLDLTSQPYTNVTGFQGVTSCAPIGVDTDGNGSVDSYQANDECVCTYDKIEYGGGATYRYYPEGEETTLEGICVGGSFAGESCQDDTDCRTSDTSTTGGTCELQTRRDTYFGWEGYCLEKDTSIQIFGSTAPDDEACLTWLPVDQLSGSTDLYAKYEEAGYPLIDSYYCADVGLYYDVHISNYDQLMNGKDDPVTSQTIACAEFPGTPGNCKDGNDSCAENVSCPDGYFALMGACAWNGSNKTDAYADVCREGAFSDNDCPYICVPKNSVHETDGGDWAKGDSCIPVGSADDTSIYGTDVYIYGDEDGNDFDAAVADNLDCVNAGVSSSRNGFGFSDGFYTSAKNFELKEIPYFACNSLVQLSSVSSGNKAWTNRLWASGAYTIEGALSNYFGYTYSTNLSPFGNSLSEEEAISELGLVGDDSDYRPVPITQCYEDSAATTPYLPQLTDSCEASVGGVTVSDGGTARAYNYVELTTSGTTSCSSDSDCTAGISCAAGSGVCYLPCTDGGTECEDNDVGECNVDAGVCTVPLSDGNETDCTSDGGDWFDSVCVGGPIEGEPCDDTSDCTVGVSCDKIDCGTLGDPEECHTTTTGQCVGVEIDTAPAISTGSDITPDAVVDRLLQIFAKSLDLQSFDDQQIGIDTLDPTDGLAGGDYQGDDLDGYDWDVTAVGDDSDTPTPPIVKSLGECFGTLCREGNEDTFTVNGEDDQVITGSDGQEHVSVSFFTYANDNQMPIKNIIVDWGDGDVDTGMDWPTTSQSGSTDPTGNFYKNHRGLLSTSQSVTYCDDYDLKHETWGTDPSACDASYVSFTHDYVCSDSYVSTLAGRECEDADNDGNIDNSPCIGSGTIGASGECIFQPRVLVKDNWGWCTGVCPGGYDGDDGCYDASSQVDLGGTNECDWDNCPGESTCYDADPWVYYDSWVEVEP